MAALNGRSLSYQLNRLAGTLNAGGVPQLDAQGAANKWAGTKDLALTGALNVKAGTKDLGLRRVCNQLGGTTDQDPAYALAQL